MSRLIESTTLRRVALASLIVLTGAFSACGDDSSGDTAAKPSTPAASTPVATTAAETTAAKKVTVYKPKTAAQNTAALVVAKQNPEIAIAPTGDKPTAADVTAVVIALKQAGYPVKATISSRKIPSSVGVNDITLGFYGSNKEAAANAKSYRKVFITDPKTGKLTLSGRRIYFISTTKPITAEEKAEFAKVSKIADDTLGK